MTSVCITTRCRTFFYSLSLPRVAKSRKNCHAMPGNKIACPSWHTGNVAESAKDVTESAEDATDLPPSQTRYEVSQASKEAPRTDRESARFPRRITRKAGHSVGRALELTTSGFADSPCSAGAYRPRQYSYAKAVVRFDSWRRFCLHRHEVLELRFRRALSSPGLDRGCFPVNHSFLGDAETP